MIRAIIHIQINVRPYFSVFWQDMEVKIVNFWGFAYKSWDCRLINFVNKIVMAVNPTYILKIQENNVVSK